MNKRLEIIFSEIAACSSFADVGCDHGYIAKAVLDSGKCDDVIISDISAPSLKKAEKLLTVFEDTAVKYGGVCVGSPIRDDFGSLSRLQAKNKLGIHDKKPVLLVTGGSQGSRTINAAVRNNLGELVKRFNVVHLCGKGNKSGNKSINGYFEYEFADMNVCLTACDLVLSRGGSNTLFEIMYCKKPAVIVPLKKGSRGDQKKNALYFVEKGAMRICNEDELAERIVPLLSSLFNDRAVIVENASRLAVENGTKNIAEILCSFRLKSKR